MPIYDFVDIYKRLFRNIKRKGGFARLPDDDYFKLSLPEVLERLERSDDRSSWTTNRMWVGYEEGSKKWAEPLKLVQQYCFERERLFKTKAWGTPLSLSLSLSLSLVSIFLHVHFPQCVRASAFFLTSRPLSPSHAHAALCPRLCRGYGRRRGWALTRRSLDADGLV